MTAIPKLVAKISQEDGYQEDEMPPSQFEERMRSVERKLDLLIEKFDQHEKWADEKAQALAVARALAEKNANEIDKAKSNLRLLGVLGGALCALGGWLLGMVLK